MKNTLVEALTLLLLMLTGLSGLLAAPEIALLPAAWLRYLPLVLIAVLTLKNAIYLYLDWRDDGLFNKSYTLPPGPTLLLLAGLCLTLPSCATRPDGTPTFAGLDPQQWTQLGLQTGGLYLHTLPPASMPPADAKSITPVLPPR